MPRTTPRTGDRKPRLADCRTTELTTAERAAWLRRREAIALSTTLRALGRVVAAIRHGATHPTDAQCEENTRAEGLGWAGVGFAKATHELGPQACRFCTEASEALATAFLAPVTAHRAIDAMIEEHVIYRTAAVYRPRFYAGTMACAGADAAFADGRDHAGSDGPPTVERWLRDRPDPRADVFAEVAFAETWEGITRDLNEEDLAALQSLVEEPEEPEEPRDPGPGVPRRTLRRLRERVAARAGYEVLLETGSPLAA